MQPPGSYLATIPHFTPEAAVAGVSRLPCPPLTSTSCPHPRGLHSLTWCSTAQPMVLGEPAELGTHAALCREGGESRIPLYTVQLWGGQLRSMWSRGANGSRWCGLHGLQSLVLWHPVAWKLGSSHMPLLQKKPQLLSPSPFVDPFQC